MGTEQQYNLKLWAFSVNIDVKNDNKLKRYLNINCYVGVYDPRFKRKYFVFYFVSVIIEKVCSKLH